MTIKHEFGGQWTIDKLDIIGKYLNAYTTALKNSPYKTIYVDAFAGTGKININDNEILGSARIALDIKNPFSYYYFFEKREDFVSELDLLKNDFPELKRRISIRQGDCNGLIKDFCETVDWSRFRSVIFLDPYATDVEYETINAIADTKAIDLWYLFPISVVNRLLPNDRLKFSHSNVLDKLFGKHNWKDIFYTKDTQLNLFNESSYHKEITTDQLKNFILSWLEELFPCVSKSSIILRNRKNSPLFLFCFAVSNENEPAQKLALKIANDILKKH